MLGMLYSRNKYCMRHILEGLKRHVRGHAETCLLIIFSSRGCVVCSPIFLSNFLGGCPNHEKIKTCTLGWYPEVWLSRHGLTFHGPPLVCFFCSNWFWTCSPEISKTIGNTQSFFQCGLHFALLLWRPTPPQKKQTATRRKTQTSKIAKTNQKRAMFPDSCLGSPLSTEESRNIVSFLVFSSLFVWFSRGFYCSDLGLIPQCRDSFRVQF